MFFEKSLISKRANGPQPNIKYPTTLLNRERISFSQLTRIVLLIFGACVCLLDAQVIYDSPPIGISLTRPILPWLARYFVNAGDRKVYFLDEPQREPSAKEEGGAAEADNESNGEGKEESAGSDENETKAKGLFTFPSVQLNEQQKAQLQQLQYMAPVPVPVLSAPVSPPKEFSTPFPSLASSQIMQSMIPIQYPVASPSFGQMLPPIHPFPVSAPAPFAIGPLPTAIATPTNAPPMNPSIASSLPIPPLPIPIAAPFIASPPAPFFPPPDPIPITADCIQTQNVQIPAPIPMNDPYVSASKTPTSPSPLSLPFTQQTYSSPCHVPTLASSSTILMSGSPKASDSKFSYRDAVLKGVPPPLPQSPPKTSMALTMRRRLNL